MRVVVTGGAGFIGSQFVRSLVTGDLPGLEGAQVVVLDKLTYAGDPRSLDPAFEAVRADGTPDRLELVVGDILDRRLVTDVLSARGGTDLVVHFAAETHVDNSISDAADFVMTNVAGTQSLLAAALQTGTGRFLHVSTDEVYGSIGTGSWTEEHILEPNSPYSASKAGSDLLARSYARTHAMEVLVTRCSNNYGPYQFPEKVIPLFVTRLLDGRKVPLYGDGSNVRDWLHVSDHCRGIALVAAGGRPGEIYNIGGGTELSNRELTGRLLAACSPDGVADWTRVDLVPDRKGHDHRYSVDISKIQDELGFEPQVGFEQGLTDTVDWYRTRRDWWEPLLARQ